ncbi:hypothetical protein B0H15DRAFT_796231 [Mycena belliarum]|uniref:Uncharacterized protein n=1 Tax=Mycena belliarum TaxID=1033014 RepID=A0AAD6UIL3_9AGAR|nr:hypothetical protein B0H15DRAFT_796231 [Mycena belliae]
MRLTRARFPLPWPAVACGCWPAVPTFALGGVYGGGGPVVYGGGGPGPSAFTLGRSSCRWHPFEPSNGVARTIGGNGRSRRRRPTLRGCTFPAPELVAQAHATVRAHAVPVGVIAVAQRRVGRRGGRCFVAGDGVPLPSTVCHDTRAALAVAGVVEGDFGAEVVAMVHTALV